MARKVITKNLLERLLPWMDRMRSNYLPEGIYDDSGKFIIDGDLCVRSRYYSYNKLSYAEDVKWVFVNLNQVLLMQFLATGVFDFYVSTNSKSNISGDIQTLPE